MTDVLGNIAEFAGISLPGARAETVTYPPVSCLTKEGDIIKGCKNVRDSMRIIHSAILDVVQEHLNMIAWIEVKVEVDVVFESELSDVASKTYWRPGAMQENEFNQWYMGDGVRGETRAGIHKIDSLDFFAIYEGLEGNSILESSYLTQCQLKMRRGCCSG